MASLMGRTGERSLRLARAGTPRLAYAAIGVLFLIFGAIAVQVYSSVKRELTEVALARRASLANLAAATLSERLDRMVDLAVSLGTRVRFAELVSAGQWEAAAQILRSVPSEFRFVDRAVLYDVQGTVMADVPGLREAKGENRADRDWYQGVSRGWKPYVSDVYRRGALPQRYVFAVVVPIIDRNATPTGILQLQIQLEQFFDWARAISLGAGGSAYVVDAKGTAAFHSSVPIEERLLDLSATPAVARLLQGKSGVEIVADAAGTEQVYAFMPGKYGWGVAMQQPASEAFAAREQQLRFIQTAYALIALALGAAGWLGVRIGKERQRADVEQTLKLELELQVSELKRAQQSLTTHTERLRILHQIDRAMVTRENPQAIAADVIQPLRELLGVPRAIVNLFDLQSGEVEWLAAAGRHRTRAGPGVRYSIRLMGDVEALRRGEPQLIDTHALPPGPEVDALLASGVHVYMAVPMIAGGELIGALSFGGEQRIFPAEQVTIAQEVATQLAIAITQARLCERVKRHAEELEQRVAERTAQLEAVNKELESFSYSVSHDLRAPLRAVDGYTKMLEEDYRDRLDDEGRRLLAVVRDSSRHMGQLIDDLLEFARVGKQVPAKQRVELTALAREVADQMARGTPAQVALAPLPAAEADRALIRQVWSNLIGNAVKYSGKQAEPRIEIGGREEATENIYWVRDNGAGFDMRYAAKLFGVFQRLHGQDEFPGTGVGLAIVQRVIVRHGGRVWAEGKPDAGACFYFSLPRGK